jgi:hypothetical protein
MRYQVVWTRRADSELADVWTDSADRNAVSYAARQIDSALARDPLACGESRTAGRRIFFGQPLVVIFVLWKPIELSECLASDDMERHERTALQPHDL